MPSSLLNSLIAPSTETVVPFGISLCRYSFPLIMYKRFLFFDFSLSDIFLASSQLIPVFSIPFTVVLFTFISVSYFFESFSSTTKPVKLGSFVKPIFPFSVLKNIGSIGSFPLIAVTPLFPLLSLNSILIAIISPFFVSFYF
jgi:hypothetical protein